ncbi:lanthionine synthetase C family protein [Streptomyces syringium]|uniref:lanthionine synthetase C family protein n=1 Tax=Streptomyces syringium TaxID=76729 RepID=UPI003666CEC9
MAGWTAVLPPDTAAAALDLVTTLAGRPRATPTCVRPDLAGGGPGLALTYHQLDRCMPGLGWDAMAEGYLSAAVKGVERLGTSTPALFGGLGGLAFAAWSLSPDAPSFRSLHDGVAREAGRRARALGDSHGMPVRVFDVITGVTGTGAYLLGRRHDPAARDALCAVLTALVSLCGEREGTPHWYTPAEALRDARTREEFPYGVLDCGLAHGIPGPLALLSLALDAGVAVPGQRETVARVAGWLAAQRTDDAWGPDWPGRAPPPGRPAPQGRRPARASWCYGSPGVARTLWLAGTALDDASLRALAVDALKAALRRPAARHRVDGTPGLCHGAAGLLHITSRFASDTGDPELARAATGLAAQLLTSPAALSAEGPGYLEGAAGVVLALLAAATDVTPTWDRSLLLA